MNPLPVSFNSAILTGSQVTIPPGSRAWQVTVQSGMAVINGSGPLNAPFSYTSSNPAATALTVGATGVVANPSKVVVVWESPAVAA